jgi:hypothetical protein
VAVKTPAPERAAGRRKLAKKRQALPDGSFPIPNVSYLGKAIRAVGRAAPGKRPALARLIRKRARQLGSAGMAKLKGSWADDTQSTKAMANALYGQLIQLNFTPEQARSEVAQTLPFFVREFATPVVGSTDGPQITTLAGAKSSSKLVSKASVHYREATDSKRCCGTCSNMLSNGHCKVVQGTVKRDDVCDRYSSGGYANSSTAVTLAKWDPDNDGDNDATPNGDTDNDRVGKLTIRQRAVFKRAVASGKSPSVAYKIACKVPGGMSKAA